MVTMLAETICIAIIDQNICPLMPGVGKIPISAISGNRRERSRQIDARMRNVRTGCLLMRLTSRNATIASSKYTTVLTMIVASYNG
jgi:hypothetical protein